VEAQFPAWVSRFLSQPQRDGTASLVLQREDLQAELQALERKILDKVLEDRRLSAQDAQAGIGVALQQGGTAGVTEEVRSGLTPKDVVVAAGMAGGGSWHECLADGWAIGTALTAVTSVLCSHSTWQEHL